MLCEPRLFLGFAMDPFFEQELSRANPYLVTLLIGKEDYLVQVKQQEHCYLGKYPPPHPTVDQLEDLEKHLLSLLNKLTPQYCFTKNRPVLVTLTHVGHVGE
jgi:hypothetical protein